MSYALPRQTNITHTIRRALNISYEEYVIADAINFICNNQKNKTKKAEGKYRELIADFVGVSTRTVDRAILNLIEKKILKQPSRQSVEMAPLWEEINSDKEFNSRHFGVSEDDTTHDILAYHSRHFGVSVYIYIHKNTRICPKPPFLTNFSTSFLNDFSLIAPILGFEAPTISFDTPKISQKAAAHGSAKGKKGAKGAAAQACELLFEEFYGAYPRKEKRAAARTRYKGLVGKHRDIMAALAVYASKVADTEKQYIKLPTTFLTDYEDYLPSKAPETPKNSQNGGGEDIDDESLEAAKTTIRKLAAALAEKYGGDMAGKKERVAGSAFLLLNNQDERIFDDATAAMVEELGGTWAAIIEATQDSFDTRASLAWTAAKQKTA